MPINPQPAQWPEFGDVKDMWSEASFYDVTLVRMMAAIIASGEYAPGPLIMELSLAATAEIMYQTGRWVRPVNTNDIDLTPEAASAIFRGMGRVK